ncbi:MAG: thiamine pyrophosphate-dependent enzyme [Anaerovoracaceae bacterium]|nr:2-oxoacid:ferredoxin oxidoreductase subunit beta [Clostridiales bacterium]
MNSLFEEYIRKEALPTLFCPGCGNGIVQQAAIRAIDKLGIRENTALVSGIGCSSWIPCYINMDVMHTIHGRALAFATGLKLAQPDKNVMVFTGDGDCLAIGGNHFIHAAGRNIDITVIMINNYIYGMTGGQKSPTTPMNAVTKTSPFGSIDYPLDGCALANTLGASYVARWTTAHPIQLEKSIKEGIETKGFSYIEVLAQCPVQGGKNVYGEKEPAAILRKYRDMAKEGTVSLGVLKSEKTKEEYIERLRKKETL